MGLALALAVQVLVLWPLLRAQRMPPLRKALLAVAFLSIWLLLLPYAFTTADILLTESGHVASGKNRLRSWMQAPEDASDIFFHRSSGIQSICCRTSTSAAEKWLGDHAFRQTHYDAEVQMHYSPKLPTRAAFEPSLSDPGLRRYSTPWAATGAHRRAFYSPRDQRLYTERSSR